MANPNQRRPTFDDTSSASFGMPPPSSMGNMGAVSSGINPHLMMQQAAAASMQQPIAPQMMMPFQAVSGGAAQAQAAAMFGHQMHHQANAFNSGLAAALAASEYQKQREASAAAHLFAASQAGGLQMNPFLPSSLAFPGFVGSMGNTNERQASLPRPAALGIKQGSVLPAIAHSPQHPNKAYSDPSTLIPRTPVFSNSKPELPPPKWYASVVPLGVDEDKHYLSELQCVLRNEFVEAFGTTQTDVIIPVHGRNKPIAIGQVGIRCQHCHSDSKSVVADDNDLTTSKSSAPNAVSYPNSISGIYNIVQQMYRIHFDNCPHIPKDLKERVNVLKDCHTSNRGGRKQYWIDSAKRIGLVDTSFGVHYGNDPTVRPLPPIEQSSDRPSAGDDDEEDIEFGMDGNPFEEEDVGYPKVPVDDVEIFPLVLPKDKDLITDYLYLALEQMQPCKLMDADRVGCYKVRTTGFPGLACKHCIGQAGCGRYFPASEASLSQTTTSQTIVNHVRNCRRCPLEIREQLELMKRAKTDPDYKKSDKPRHGGRKVFFHRLWCRIQGLPLPENDILDDDDNNGKGKDKQSTTSENKSKSPIRSPGSGRKKRKKRSDAGVSKSRKAAPKRSLPSRNDYDSDQDDRRKRGRVKTIEFDNVHGESTSSTSSSKYPKATTANMICDANENKRIIYQGRTRLSRGDDPHWLSEADCFIRRELAEVFSAKEEHLEMYCNFGLEPEIAQVGVRCFYCAENKDTEDRSKTHAFFPLSVGGVQQAVADLSRRHLGLCTEIPNDVRKSFQSMEGYGETAKKEKGQYWVDSARELGLMDSHESQGIVFFRNPTNNSPADDLDIDKSNDAPTGSSLVPAEERSKCTDRLLLLLSQFEPCKFHSSDRKSSRSRDRSIGFPGLVCIACKQKRYFPINEKKFQDSLSLMATHISNCYQTPLDVKASLGYLQHRALLQKNELSGQWKYTFLKGVWGRLHRGGVGNGTGSAPATDADDATTSISTKEGKLSSYEDSPVEDDEEMVDTSEFYAEEDYAEDEDDNNTDALGGEMKDMIKAAALWLCERDAEYEARGGRVRASKKR